MTIGFGLGSVRVFLAATLLASGSAASADSLSNFLSRVIQTVIDSANGAATPAQEADEIEEAWHDFHIGDPDNLFRPDFFVLPRPQPTSGFGLFLVPYKEDPVDPDKGPQFDFELNWPDPSPTDPVVPVPSGVRFEVLEHPELIDPSVFIGLNDQQSWDLLTPSLTYVGTSSDVAHGFPMHVALHGFEPILFAISQDANGDDLLGTRMIGVLPSVRYDAVPEPASWAMMLLGFGLMGFVLRQQQDRRYGTA